MDLLELCDIEPKEDVGLFCVDHNSHIIALCLQCMTLVCKECTTCNNHRKCSIYRYMKNGLSKKDLASFKSKYLKNIRAAKKCLKRNITFAKQFVSKTVTKDILSKIEDSIIHWDSNLFKDEEVYRKSHAYALSQTSTNECIDEAKKKILSYIDAFRSTIHTKIFANALNELCLRTCDAKDFNQLSEFINEISWSSADIQLEYDKRVCEYFEIIRASSTFLVYIKMLKSKLMLVKILENGGIDYELERFIIHYCYLELKYPQEQYDLEETSDHEESSSPSPHSPSIMSSPVSPISRSGCIAPNMKTKQEHEVINIPEPDDDSYILPEECFSFGADRKFLWFVQAAINAPMKNRLGLKVTEPVFLPISYSGCKMCHASLSEFNDFAYCYLENGYKSTNEKDDGNFRQDIGKTYMIYITNFTSGASQSFESKYKASIGFFGNLMFLFLDGTNLVLEAPIKKVYAKGNKAFRPHFLKSNISGYAETQLCPTTGIALVPLQNKTIIKYDLRSFSVKKLTKGDGDIVSTLGTIMDKYNCFFTSGVQDLKQKKKSKAILNVLEASTSSEIWCSGTYTTGSYIGNHKGTNDTPSTKRGLKLVDPVTGFKITKVTNSINHPKYILAHKYVPHVLEHPLMISDEGMISTSPPVSMKDVIESASHSIFYTRLKQLGLKESVDLEGTGGFAMVRAYENVFICFDIKRNGWVSVRIDP